MNPPTKNLQQFFTSKTARVFLKNYLWLDPINLEAKLPSCYHSILSILLLYFSPLENGVASQMLIIFFASSKFTSSAGRDKTLVSSCSRDCLAVWTSSARAERTPLNLLAVMSTPTPEPQIKIPLSISGLFETFSATSLAKSV